MQHLLSCVTFLPLLGALILAFVPSRLAKVHVILGLLFTSLVLVGSWNIFSQVGIGQTGFILNETYAWMPSIGVSYSVAVDGMSAIFVLLTALLTVLALSARLITNSDETAKSFVISMLALETAMIGSFLARDLLLFYMFFEATLVPMYYLIGVYGGKKRIYATLKFFIFTMVGSVFMLLAILGLYSLSVQQFGQATMALDELIKLNIPMNYQIAMLVMFVFAFAVKIPVFPFHTWLPDAHVEAPTAGSVILAGILLKLGGYGIVRIGLPLFPAAFPAVAPYLAMLGVIGILYGAYAAWAQLDMKKLVAYSSVSHMGFVVVGLASGVPSAVTGAVFQMVAHGLSTGALFLLIGMIYDRRHTRLMADYGGLVKVMPLYATLFIVTTMASIGLPGLCGFVGEFMILSGSFKSELIHNAPWMVGISVLGIVFGAGYMLMLVERVFWGKIKFSENKLLKDLHWKEVAVVLPLVILMFVLGVYPKPVLERIDQSVSQALVQNVDADVSLNAGAVK